VISELQALPGRLPGGKKQEPAKGDTGRRYFVMSGIGLLAGAITLFSPESKSQLFMGTARIHLENCLLLKNKECVRCKESCKYEAIKFVEEGNILNVLPVADSPKCVGCGACAVVCPVGCFEIYPIHPA